MAVLKSYTCSKCAGVLIFDSDQEFFDCPFCGNKFNVVDFHGDEILSQAKECLAKKSFDVASDKFNSMLENEPENFEALLGTILCELRIRSIKELSDRKVFEGRDLSKVKKLIINAKKQTPSGESKFFGKIMEIINLHEKLSKLEKEKKEISSDDTRKKIDEKMTEDFKEVQAKELSDKAWLVYVVFGVLAAVMLPMAAIVPDFMYVRIYLCVLVAVFLVYAIIHSVNTKKTEAAYKPAQYLSNSYNTRLSIGDSDYSKACSDLQAMYPTSQRAREKKLELSGAKESRKFSETDINLDEMIICSKCAAKLNLDKSKRVYQCNHCGVAYGVSLFFGLPMEKALGSMNTGYYGDAEQRFESILMIHPSDFEALLGRILCAGKWTKVSDIDLTDDVSSEREDNVKKMIGEALQHSSVDNRPYFETIEKLISLYGTYSENLKKLDELNNELSDFDAKAEIYSYAYNEEKDKKKRALERKDIIAKSYPYRVENKKIEEEFAALRRTLLGMRSDSPIAN